MKTAFAVIGFVVVALVVGTCVACNDDDDSRDGYVPVQLVSHEQPRCYEDECDDEGYDQRYDQNYGSRDDRNRNRQRNRGAFSPGPFEDSPVDAFNGNTICLPGSTCTPDDRNRRDQPEEGR
jgi:hypothetical protein